MIITKHTPTTTIDLWYPKYSTKYNEATKEWSFMPACYKVQDGRQVIIIEFSKAKHMAGLRYCMLRSEVMDYPTGSNGTIECYIVPKSKWQAVETPADILQTVKSFGW